VIECLERSFGAERIDVEALIERARRSRASIARTTGSRITQREIDRLKRQGRP
jgi:hypothetical protein